MLIVRHYSRLVMAVVIAVGVSSCGGAEDEGRPLESFSAEELYQRAEFELESNGNAEEAARFFGEVERLYPYSEWASRALIMQAFSYHRDRDFESSRGSAQRFLNTYPADEDAAYAQYLLALSYYDQIDDVGRDQGLTFQALQSLRDVIEQYPDSDYARSAILKFDLAFDHLAERKTIPPINQGHHVDHARPVLDRQRGKLARHPKIPEQRTQALRRFRKLGVYPLGDCICQHVHVVRLHIVADVKRQLTVLLQHINFR